MNSSNQWHEWKDVKPKIVPNTIIAAIYSDLFVVGRYEGGDIIVGSTMLNGFIQLRDYNLVMVLPEPTRGAPIRHERIITT